MSEQLSRILAQFPPSKDDSPYGNLPRFEISSIVKSTLTFEQVRFELFKKYALIANPNTTSDQVRRAFLEERSQLAELNAGLRDFFRPIKPTLYVIIQVFYPVCKDVVPREKHLLNTFFTDARFVCDNSFRTILMAQAVSGEIFVLEDRKN